VDWSPRIGRLMLASFAIWQGYIAIELLSCETVRWIGVRAACAPDIVAGQESTWLSSGVGHGTLVLVAVVAVLLWLWVWPFVRQARIEKRSQGVDV